MEECKFTIPTQYQKWTLYNPIFRLLKADNNKTVTKLKLQNVKIQTIPIPIKLLGIMPKKGQDLGPNNIVEQYVQVCVYIIIGLTSDYNLSQILL